MEQKTKEQELEEKIREIFNKYRFDGFGTWPNLYKFINERLIPELAELFRREWRLHSNELELRDYAKSKEIKELKELRAKLDSETRWAKHYLDRAGAKDKEIADLIQALDKQNHKLAEALSLIARHEERLDELTNGIRE